MLQSARRGRWRRCISVVERMFSLLITQRFSAIERVNRFLASVQLFSLRPPTPNANTHGTRIKLAYLLNASVGIVKRTRPSVCQQ